MLDNDKPYKSLVHRFFAVVVVNVDCHQQLLCATGLYAVTSCGNWLRCDTVDLIFVCNFFETQYNTV